jgi:hypothetical protein
MNILVYVWYSFIRKGEKNLRVDTHVYGLRNKQHQNTTLQCLPSLSRFDKIILKTEMAGKKELGKQRERLQ